MDPIPFALLFVVLGLAWARLAVPNRIPCRLRPGFVNLEFHGSFWRGLPRIREGSLFLRLETGKFSHMAFFATSSAALKALKDLSLKILTTATAVAVVEAEVKQLFYERKREKTDISNRSHFPLKDSSL